MGLPAYDGPEMEAAYLAKLELPFKTQSVWRDATNDGPVSRGIGHARLVRRNTSIAPGRLVAS